MDRFELSDYYEATPFQLYEAWVDGEQHTAFTGAEATSEPRPGGRFTAWDGYIEGTHVDLEPGARIVQRWRTSEFPEEAPDSVLEVRFTPEHAGTRLDLRHSGVPAGDGPKYAQGWRDFYLDKLHEWLARG